MKFFCIVGVFSLSLVLFSGCKNRDHENTVQNNFHKKFRILHIMSYHSPWEWTDNQVKGFRAALSDLDIDMTVFQMDTKRKSSEQWKEEVGRKARELIDSTKPDLVFTSDDNAQIYVSKYYINKGIPFVFSAVNALPEDYGFVGAKNVAGVLEIEHVLPSIRLLQAIVPKARRIAVLTDVDPTWPRVMERMKKLQKADADKYEYTAFYVIKTFDEFKRIVRDLQTRADALCLLGIFTYKDEKGNNVSQDDVLRWVTENSRLPDFSLWGDRVMRGTLCSVSVSAYEQGFAAGKIAHGILAEGKKPSDYEFMPTLKGEPLVNKMRASRLGINIESNILLSSHVYNTINYSY